jgi:tRNA threonylcarbamoyladenosine biosynthesis protein TsaB
MPSLSQILHSQSPLLLLDAGSERIQVGLLGPGATARWSTRKEEAGVGIFECIEELAADLGSVRAFAFCEGPGSILGIRTAAVALRMWGALEPRPRFAYQSLAVVARALGSPGATVIADARRGLWHRLSLGSPLGRVPASELSGDLVMPEGFRHWDPLPPGTRRVPYDLPTLFGLPAVAEADLFRETAEPDAFLHQEPAYATWVPQIHRAP